MGRLTVGLIVSLWIIPVSILVNHIVPEPYMDEIFHVPQAQEYCRANFRSWDPMITTPPGLYCLSLAYVASLFPGMHLLQMISSFSVICSTAILRSFNGVVAVLCSILVYDIIRHLRPALDTRKATLFAVVLSLYPLHWFFAFLYYTDVASLTVVLAMYLASLKKNYFMSALLGALAVCIRQTNIIWMLFVACSGVIEMLLVHQRHISIAQKYEVFSGENRRTTPKNHFAADSGLRRRKGSLDYLPPATSSGNEAAISRSQFSGGHTVYQVNGLSGLDHMLATVPLIDGFIHEIYCIVVGAWHMKWQLLVSFSPFIIVLGSFVAFVYWNGSVVLGAKEAHSVSPHFAQIMYFALVSVLFSALFHFTLGHVYALLQSLWKNKSLSSALVSGFFAAGLLSVHYFSIAHPYLLADNRHYPFYIWRKVINAHSLIKYFLVLPYVYSWLSILSILGKTQSRIWVLAYFLACVAVLVPTPLVEFRYYTIPFFIFMLNCGIDEASKWFLIGLMYIAVNVFTLYMFLFRPFRWTHEPGVQRFIW